MPDIVAYLGKHIYATIRDARYRIDELIGEREDRRENSNLNGGKHDCAISEGADADRSRIYPYGRANLDNIQLRKRTNGHITLPLSLTAGDKKVLKMMAPKTRDDDCLNHQRTDSRASGKLI